MNLKRPLLTVSDFSLSRLKLAILLPILFLIAFPKGGIKSNEVPITFGYIILGLYSIFFVIINAVRKNFNRVRARATTAYALTLPLSIYSILLMSVNGVDSFGYAISFQTGFTVLPSIFLIVLAPQLQTLDRPLFLKYLCNCITFAAIFGIIAFIYKLQTGEFIQIPYLTLNADDVGELDNKYIDRGNGLFKLISTYNNGNIYGVCMLMLLPLYDLSQKSNLLKIVLRISLILTLSRTVWLGMIAYEVLRAVYLRRLQRNSALAFLFLICSVVAGILLLINIVGFDLGFIFDSNLGGRAEIISATKWNFIQNSPVSFPSEIIIVNFIAAFGVLSLLLYFVSAVCPILLAFCSPQRKDPFVRACIGGMIMLQACGLSDGPILLIPIMAFYWALAGLALIPQDQPSLENKIGLAIR